MQDFAMLQRCLQTGPDAPTGLVTRECRSEDLSGNYRVDAEDLAIFFEGATGPAICPYAPSPPAPGPSDLDSDGDVDMCDMDTEDDGILNDGDNDGQWFYYVCTGGATTNCDDNCGNDWNPDQEDWDGDWIGDACDATPGEPPEGEGLMGGGELLMSESMSVESLDFEPLLFGCEGVNAYLAEHGTGARSLTP